MNSRCLLLFFCLTGCLGNDESSSDSIEPVALTSAAAETVNEGWPCLFGPRQTNVSAEVNVSTNWPHTGPARLWERPVGDGYSSPVVRDQTLVIHHRIHNEEIVEAFHAKTGDSLWTAKTPTDFKCRWEYSSGPYATPILTQDSVFAIGAKARLCRLQRATGEEIWSRDLQAELDIPPQLFAFGTTPLLRDGRLYLNAGAKSAGVICLDAKTGETIWQATDYTASCSTPALATIFGQAYLFVLAKEGLVCLDPDTGHEHWFYEFAPRKDDSINACLPIVFGNRIFLTAGPGHGCAVLEMDADGNYREVWRKVRLLDSQFNPVILLNEHVYGYPSMWNGSAYFRCLSLADGKVKWKWESEHINRGTSLAVAGHFILLGEHGHLALLEISETAARPKFVSEKPILKSPCFSTPALQNGLLYLRNERQAICLDLRPTD